ncbi:MAG: hypothetical protein A2231_02075 [Candidatus Firestonebacteria bacterium RIFOXYA2_FULL_40_8]|nr:MAG: hypothetical protein A2231_02075 [Candidatus Firestonebacteria bacterium RIFOXYA2_FULL_40_8]
MNQATTVISICFFLITFLSGSLFSGVGTESMQFLKIKPSARAASLGDSFVSIANDVNATFYNPAGLAQLDNTEISLMHMVYIQDTGYEFGTVVFPMGDKLRIGAYVIFMNYGSIARTLENGSGMLVAGTESYAPYDLSTAVSVGYKLSKNISLGANIKIAYSDIDGNKLSGLMGDAGLLIKLTEETSLGGVVYNVGSAINGSTVPMLVKGGLSTSFSLAEQNDLLLGVGANYISASAKLSGSIGLEYNYQNIFFVRTGYGMASEADGINIGAGVKQDLGGMTGMLDYNFSLMGDLGSAHRVSVGIKFGEEYPGKSKRKSSNVKSKNGNSGIRNYYKPR